MIRGRKRKPVPASAAVPEPPVASAPAAALLPDEGELLRRARNGDSAAWAGIYAQYQPPIMRFCRHALGHREDAEDAAAEVLFKVRLALDRFDLSRPFAPWLYRVAANHCLDILRRRSRQMRGEDDIETVAITQPGQNQLERVIQRQSSERVRAALERLPARSRMVLLLRYYSELSYDEIASALAVPRPYVGVLLLRARQSLREALESDAPGGEA